MNGNYIEQVQPRSVVVRDQVIASVTNVAYATRIDDASQTNVTYIGKALPGSATSGAVWQIQKIDETQSPETTIITFADGNANFDNVWTNRLLLSYS
jgi:hypothetical protein